MEIIAAPIITYGAHKLKEPNLRKVSPTSSEPKLFPRPVPPDGRIILIQFIILLPEIEESIRGNIQNTILIIIELAVFLHLADKNSVKLTTAISVNMPAPAVIISVSPTLTAGRQIFPIL